MFAYVVAAQLRQAVSALLDNACDAVAEAGSRVVTLETVMRRERCDGTNHVLIRVCDNGVGIDGTIENRVFDRGYSTKGEGRGLGLAMARDFVRSFGGTIEVVNPPTGMSTCLKIALLIAKPETNKGFTRREEGPQRVVAFSPRGMT